MIELNLSAIFSSSPNRSNKNKFWKSPKQDKSLLKNGGVLMCNNLEDAETLNNLIAQKVKSLKTVENVYVRDITNLSKIIIKRENISVLTDDTYADEKECNEATVVQGTRQGEKKSVSWARQRRKFYFTRTSL